MNGTDHLKYLRPKFHYSVEKSIARDGTQRAFGWICSYCIVARILCKPYTFSHAIFTIHRCLCVCAHCFRNCFCLVRFFSVYLFLFIFLVSEHFWVLWYFFFIYNSKNTRRFDKCHSIEKSMCVCVLFLYSHCA